MEDKNLFSPVSHWYLNHQDIFSLLLSHPAFVFIQHLSPREGLQELRAHSDKIGIFDSDLGSELWSLFVTPFPFSNQFFLKKCQKASLPPQVRVFGTSQSSVLGPGDACVATSHNSSKHKRNILIFSLHFPHFGNLPKHTTSFSKHIAKEHKIDFGTDWAQALNTSISRTYEKKLHYCAFTSTPPMQKWGKKKKSPKFCSRVSWG